MPQSGFIMVRSTTNKIHHALYLERRWCNPTHGQMCQANDITYAFRSMEEISPCLVSPGLLSNPVQIYPL